ncbi:Probable transcriptional regulatory protein pdtaR [Cedecea lapagei]|uniref:Probable transcriptional regulatory protein pdtaR n=1 Tax=Cedecea lapagei TaxID=158823 RepID=A0A3S4IN82_9ENTR|nr:nitrate regulatory protein [Cedecea lapagei]VEB97689.1 Probable transcriptional regulatory protein pdtaR [Cedecea lapagei]
MPLSALSFVLASKKSEIICLQQLLEMGRLVGVVSQLIHVLQRERGTANIFLCSHGELWADKLSESALQVQLAEHAVDDLLQALDLSGQSMSNAPRLFSRIAAVLHSLSTLPLLRRQVQAQEVDQPEAMRQYSDVIRTHLALVFEAADISGDPTISRALLAMFSFMQGKELVGQERALGAAGFAARHFDEVLQQQLLDLIEGQERCFLTFSEFADARCLALWQRLLDADSSEFERLRRIACTRTIPADNGGETALRWFEVTTARINDMKRVEDLLEDVLMACCRQRISDAQASLAVQQQDIGQIPSPEPHYSALIPPQLSRAVLELVEKQSRQLQAQDAELAELRATLAERKLVERAKGLLMQHHGMTEPQAHKILRDMAMNQNRKLSDVAEAMFAMSAILSKKGD